MKITFKVNSIFILFFLIGISFSKSTGPIPESEAYMMEQVEMISPENEWVDYANDQDKIVIMNINGNSITEPDCNLGREDEFVRKNWNPDIQSGLYK